MPTMIKKGKAVHVPKHYAIKVYGEKEVELEP
jgi:hypothetical protein